MHPRVLRELADVIVSLPSQALTQGIPVSRSVKRPMLALLKSKVVTLLIGLLPPLRILNFTISW